LLKKELELTSTKFNPNDPKYWKEFDPFEKSNEYIDGKSETSIKISCNNRRTWANPDVKARRQTGMTRAKQESGSCPPEIYAEVYANSWGADRKKGYVADARRFLKSKGYNFHKDRVYQIMSNGLMTVDEQTHQQNITKWDKTFGFGIWEITSPGIDLLEEYDRVWSDNRVPPSVVWHIRFNMAQSTPKEVRDYLLPWTMGDYYRSSDGRRIENGRYIDLRKKKFPFLINEPCQYTIFDNKEKLTEWLRVKMKRATLNYTYLHQILHNNDEIKMVGPLSGYRIRRVN